MATADAAAPTKNILARTSEFYREVRAEMARVTWPDWPQIRQLSIGVIALSLFIGAIIALMDVILQQVLVVWIPRLFGAA
jgi:preprotein translocase subunit SecE